MLASSALAVFFNFFFFFRPACVRREEENYFTMNSSLGTTPGFSQWGAYRTETFPHLYLSKAQKKNRDLKVLQ